MTATGQDGSRYLHELGNGDTRGPYPPLPADATLLYDAVTVTVGPINVTGGRSVK